MPYDQLVPPFLAVLGLLKETVVDPSDPVNLQIVRNYRKWPLLSCILARMDGVWADGCGVNCVTVKETHHVRVYTTDGEIRLRFSSHARKRLRQQVREYKGHVKWVYIVLGLTWDVTPEDPASHLALMIVDTVNDTYSYFDPASGEIDLEDPLQPNKQRASNMYDIFACDDCDAFILGYKYVDRRQPGKSLQSTVDTTDETVKLETEVPSGLCAVITFLVLVCCHRFQSGNPWTIAYTIRRFFNAGTSKEQENFRANMTSWYMHIYHAKRWKDVVKLFGVCGVTAHGADPPVCGVLDITNTTPCSNRPCVGSVLCDKHLYKLVLQSLMDRDHATCFITHDVLELRGPFR